LGKKISKTANYTIIKNYGQLKGAGARPPKYATGIEDGHAYSVQCLATMGGHL